MSNTSLTKRTGTRPREHKSQKPPALPDSRLIDLRDLCVVSPDDDNLGPVSSWLRKNNKNTHHIIARHRIRQLEIASSNFSGNRIQKQAGVHNAFHHLFGTMMADEIITSLERGWRPTGGIQKVAWLTIWDDKSLEQVIADIRWNWSIEFTNPFMYRMIIEKRDKWGMGVIYQKIGGLTPFAETNIQLVA